jgi:putative copper export protein
MKALPEFVLSMLVAATAMAGYMPARAHGTLRTVAIVLRIESIALFLVLAAAAILTNSAPPAA